MGRKITRLKALISMWETLCQNHPKDKTQFTSDIAKDLYFFRIFERKQNIGSDMI